MIETGLIPISHKEIAQAIRTASRIVVNFPGRDAPISVHIRKADARAMLTADFSAEHVPQLIWELIGIVLFVSPKPVD